MAIDMKKIVTFDFDKTLEKSHIQQYASFLMDKGIEVWIVTARYDDLHLNPFSHNGTNEDLYEVTDDLHIMRSHIIFTNKMIKGAYFQGVESVIWHLDDDIEEVNSINNETNTVAFHTSENWMEKCNQLLNISRI